MRKTKRTISILLTLCMIVMLVPAVFAATPQIVEIAEKPNSNYNQPADIYALRADGTVWILSSAPYSMPEQVEGLSNIVKVCTDLALDADGNVWQFTGADDAFQVPTLSNIKDIATDGNGKMALAENGNCYVFDGSYASDSFFSFPGVNFGSTPTLWETNVAMISGCRDGLWMLKNDGTARGLGARVYGWTLRTEIDPVRVPYVKSIAFQPSGNRSMDAVYLMEDGMLLNPEIYAPYPVYYSRVSVQSVYALGSGISVIYTNGTSATLNIYDWRDTGISFNFPSNVKQIIGSVWGTLWALDTNGNVTIVTHNF